MGGAARMEPRRRSRHDASSTGRERINARSYREAGGRVRLVCLPYAGGAASLYRDWPARPPDVDLVAPQLPGREERFGEPVPTELTALVDDLLPTVAALGPPVVLFGHSMGALVAYELARRLTGDGFPPATLVVSAHPAPHLPQRHPPLHRLPDAAFVDQLRRLGGTPSGVFEEPELVELLLPALRADFTATETYRSPPGPRLGCRILAVGGRDDPRVEAGELDAWRAHTSGPFTQLQLPGDHFFAWDAGSGLSEVLRATLAEVGAAAAYGSSEGG